MYAERHEVSLTTDASGDALGYTDPVTGRVLAVLYTKPGTNGLETANFAITTETTGQTIWNESNVDASKSVFPRAATHSTAGVAALYAAGGSPVLEPVVAVQERIKIVVASGGDTKRGSFIVIVG